MSAREIVDEIIELSERIVTLTEEFEKLPIGEQSNELAKRYDTMLSVLKEDSDVPVALIRLIDLLCILPEGASKIVVLGLAHPNPDIRQISGESLLAIAEDDVHNIEAAIDYAIEDQGFAAIEMPLVLTNIEDSHVVEQIVRFLDHDSIEAVASAIEALADVGDPSAVPSLERLQEDD